MTSLSSADSHPLLLNGHFPDEAAWAREEADATLAFWAAHSLDGSGGFISQLLGDGTPFDRSTRHVVASSRFVVNFSLGSLVYGSERYRRSAEAALDFLQSRFSDRRHGGYFWILREGGDSDSRKFAYGQAFVVLAAASAVKAGIPGGDDLLASVTELAEQRFFAADDLAWNSASADWSTVSPYRGQNANMHFCEAYIASYEATGEECYLDRAFGIADALVRGPAARGKAVWESYDEYWKPVPIPAFGVDASAMESRWGIVPGHQAEWAKLLGILARHRPEPWLLPAAVNLYRFAWDHGWDASAGGFFQGLHADGSVAEPAKCYWSPSEALGAAAVLQQLTGEGSYAEDRSVLWRYVAEYMMDQGRGGWFKSPSTAAGRTDFRKGDIYDPDYHALGACFEVLRSLGR